MEFKERIMKQKSFVLILFVLSLALFSAQLQSFALEGAQVEIKSSDVKVFVGCNQIRVKAFNIDGYNYFKLRDLAQALSGSDKQFDVAWNAEQGRIDLLPKKAYSPVGGELSSTELTYTKVDKSESVLYVNNYKVIVNSYNIDGNNYFKLRDITSLFNIRLNWDARSKTILLDPSATGRPS